MREEKNGQNGWSNLSKHPDTAYYLQDELGSPIRLLDEEGNMRETYGYDEFGQDLYRNQGQIQPFGYTGYQSDRIAGTYYAQAREYRAELGRFAGVDIIKGFAAAPYTLNEYGYCWGNPMVLVDLNGRSPKKIKGKDNEDEIVYSTEISYDESTVTFCVEAPDKGSRNAIASGMEVGHTFIIIDFGNGETYTRGFYPEEGLTVKQIILREDVSGVVYNDSGHSILTHYHAFADELTERLSCYPKNGETMLKIIYEKEPTYRLTDIINEIDSTKEITVVKTEVGSFVEWIKCVAEVLPYIDTFLALLGVVVPIVVTKVNKKKQTDNKQVPNKDCVVEINNNIDISQLSKKQTQILPEIIKNSIDPVLQNNINRTVKFVLNNNFVAVDDKHGYTTQNLRSIEVKYQSEH